MAEYPPTIGGQTKTPRELDLARRVFRISKHCTDDGQNEIRMPESGRAVNRIPSRRQPNRATMVRTWCSLIGTRSEEHTSELQSLAYLVCRLLLEKKKKMKT